MLTPQSMTTRQSTATLVAALLALALAAAPALAGPREQARRMHDRIVGVPPSADVLQDMVDAATPVDAAFIAMENPEFYITALKNFVTPWTNVEQTVHADLNDYTATVIGIIRDDIDFRKVLTGNIVYVGADGIVGRNYSQTDNEHYRRLENDRVDLSNPNLLVKEKQSKLPDSQLPASQTAGVLTTRAAGEAFFSAGTNRRMWRFTGMNYLCRDMEQLKDFDLGVDRIRQDVSRSPGGDSQLFHTFCVGCHTGMDAVSGAFAYFDWDEDQNRVVHTNGTVQEKYLINNGTFPGGHITTDNSWENYWRSGNYAHLGWRGGPSGGAGPKSLGSAVAESRAFSECQVEKVFEHLCFRPPRDQDDRDAVLDIADSFEANDYRMKQVFAEVAAYCKGD